MRLFISVDIEGVAGVDSLEHLMPSGWDYQQARQWMTRTVLAAVRAASVAGATEIVVSDGHGNANNLLLDQLPANVQVVRGWPRKLGQADGVQTGHFEGALFLGYHAGVDVPDGNLAHTLSGGALTSVRMNGSECSEAMLNAAVCGHFGVPVLLLSGDDLAIAQTRRFLPQTHYVCTKEARGFLSASTVTPARSDDLISAGVTAALSAPRPAPFVIDGPIELEVGLKDRLQAELISYLPGVRRTGAFSIQLTASDILEANRWLFFMIFARAQVF